MSTELTLEDFRQHNIQAVEESKNQYRIDTDHGPVIYYAKRAKWQHRGRVGTGQLAEFQVWLKKHGMLR